jgi:hypothetical protein
MWEICVVILKVRFLDMVKRFASTAMLRASISASVMPLEVTGILNSLWFKLELVKLNYNSQDL